MNDRQICKLLNIKDVSIIVTQLIDPKIYIFNMGIFVPSFCA